MEDHSTVIPYKPCGRKDNNHPLLEEETLLLVLMTSFQADNFFTLRCVEKQMNMATNWSHYWNWRILKKYGKHIHKILSVHKDAYFWGGVLLTYNICAVLFCACMTTLCMCACVTTPLHDTRGSSKYLQALSPYDSHRISKYSCKP